MERRLPVLVKQNLHEEVVLHLVAGAARAYIALVLVHHGVHLQVRGELAAATAPAIVV